MDKTLPWQPHLRVRHSENKSIPSVGNFRSKTTVNKVKWDLCYQCPDSPLILWSPIPGSRLQSSAHPPVLLACWGEALEPCSSLSWALGVPLWPLAWICAVNLPSAPGLIFFTLPDPNPNFHVYSALGSHDIGISFVEKIKSIRFLEPHRFHFSPPPSLPNPLHRISPGSGNEVPSPGLLASSLSIWPLAFLPGLTSPSHNSFLWAVNVFEHVWTSCLLKRAPLYLYFCLTAVHSLFSLFPSSPRVSSSFIPLWNLASGFVPLLNGSPPDDFSNC